MLVIHHNDADGRCAAAIVERWNNKQQRPSRLRFIEMDYKDPCPLEEIKQDESVFIVDFHFKPPDMVALRERAGWVCWCDHHVTSKEYDYAQEEPALPGLRDFSDKGQCGAELTWQYLFPQEPIPYAVRILGDYDSWRLEHTPLTFLFYEGLKIQGTHPVSPVWDQLFGLDSEGQVARIASDGETIVAYRDSYCNEMLSGYGYETMICGVQAYACNIYKFGSKGFSDAMGAYPLCIAYVHDGLQYTVSLYSLGTVDVSAIAKEFGGGGHKGAAGFTCEHLPFRRVRKLT